MCHDNSVTKVCGRPAGDYYAEQPQSHTDLNLCGAINVYIVQKLFLNDITPTSSERDYDITSPFLDSILEGVNLKQNGSRMFQQTFYPLVQQRVAYYLSMLDRHEAFVPGTDNRKGPKKDWRLFRDWDKDMTVIAVWMQARSILHDDRLEPIGTSFDEICKAARDSSEEVDDFVETDLATQNDAQLKALRVQVTLEFHRVAGRAAKFQMKLEEALAVGATGEHGILDAPVDLAYREDVVLQVDLASLSRDGLDEVFRQTGKMYLDNTLRAGEIKKRLDIVGEEVEHRSRRPGWR